MYGPMNLCPELILVWIYLTNQMNLVCLWARTIFSLTAQFTYSINLGCCLRFLDSFVVFDRGGEGTARKLQLYNLGIIGGVNQVRVDGPYKYALKCTKQGSPM
jgi:hypothetical protein